MTDDAFIRNVKLLNKEGVTFEIEKAGKRLTLRLDAEDLFDMALAEKDEE